MDPDSTSPTRGLLAGLALAAAVALAPAAEAVTPVSPHGCAKVTRRFGEAARITEYLAGCTTARALASRMIQRATDGRLGPVTVHGYRCRLTSGSEAQIVHGRCTRGDAYVTWRQFIANG